MRACSRDCSSVRSSIWLNRWLRLLLAVAASCCCLSRSMCRCRASGLLAYCACWAARSRSSRRRWRSAACSACCLAWVSAMSWRSWWSSAWYWASRWSASCRTCSSEAAIWAITASRGSGGAAGCVGWAGGSVSASMGAVGGGVVLPLLAVGVCGVWQGVCLTGEGVVVGGEWIGVLRLGHPSGEGGR